MDRAPVLLGGEQAVAAVEDGEDGEEEVEDGGLADRSLRITIHRRPTHPSQSQILRAPALPPPGGPVSGQALVWAVLPQARLLRRAADSKAISRHRRNRVTSMTRTTVTALAQAVLRLADQPPLSVEVDAGQDGTTMIEESALPGGEKAPASEARATDKLTATSTASPTRPHIPHHSTESISSPSQAWRSHLYTVRCNGPNVATHAHRSTLTCPNIPAAAFEEPRYTSRLQKRCAETSSKLSIAFQPLYAVG